MKTSNLKTLATTSREGVPGKIEVGLRYIEGNHDAYFSLTGWYKGKGQDFGGCCHDEILAKRPDLKPFAELHLSDSDGVPMHAEADGWYQLAGALGGMNERYHAGIGERQHWKADGSFDGYRLSTPAECLQQFADHCRIPLAEAQQIADEMRAIVNGQAPDKVWFPKVCAKARARFGQIIEAMKPRWKREADEAIEQLNKL